VKTIASDKYDVNEKLKLEAVTAMGLSTSEL
jgi:hypothetical protein